MLYWWETFELVGRHIQFIVDDIVDHGSDHIILLDTFNLRPLTPYN